MKTKILILISLCAFVIQYSFGQIPVLNSLPGSTSVIYLDFDGHSDNSGNWDNWGFSNPIVTASAVLTTAQYTEIHNRVSEDYRPFNINITTSLATYNAAAVANRQRIVITPTSQFYTNQNGSAGGVAFINTFGGGEIAGYVFTNFLSGPKSYAEACSHEAGHTLGLNHHSKFDAVCNKTTEYNSGLAGPSTQTGWAPIMGNSYSRNVTTWYKGASNGSTCTAATQDDLSIITTTNGFSYRTDDVGNTNATATTLSFFGGQFNATRILSTNSDVDVFKITIPVAGTYSFLASPYSINTATYDAANVDLDMTINFINSSGSTVNIHSSPLDRLDASYSAFFNSGDYYIKITNQGLTNYVDVGGTGTTDYGSIGQYSVNVTQVFTPGAITSTTTALCSPADPTPIAFTIGATSGSSYQWYFRNGIVAPPAGTATTVGWTLITGATGSTYDSPLLTIDRTFACRVTNGATSQWANGARVFTVRPAVSYGSLAAGNQSFVFPTGNPAIINFAASGSPTGGSGTFTYQWYSFPGIAEVAPSGTAIPAFWTAIAGATGSSYDPPTVGENTAYAVRVTPGACGVTTWASGVRQITVLPLSSFNAGTLASGNQTICFLGDPANITFSTAAAGASTFQWYYQNGIVPAPLYATNPPVGWTLITGATAANYDYPPGLAISRTYACRVSNPGFQTKWATGVRQVTVLPSPFAGSLIVNQTGCTGYNPAPITMATNPVGSGAYNWRWYYWENTTQVCPTGNVVPAGAITSTTDTRFFGTSTTGVGINFDPTSSGASGRTWALLITPSANGSIPGCGVAQFASSCHKTLVTVCREDVSNEDVLKEIEIKSALDQNIPNPFDRETRITCFIPEEIQAASIQVYGLDGRMVAERAITDKGNQEVVLAKGNLSPGIYVYSLVLDGQKKAFKRMIVSK